MSNLMPIERIENKIHLIRDKKVMIDFDLAQLYEIETKYLKRQVNRNPLRFPPDFTFRLTQEEYKSLRCHFGTLKRGRHTKYLPYAFTEQGIAMLSSVLNSERAILVNVAIMRTFIRIKQILQTHKVLAEKIAELERKYNKHDIEMQTVFEVLKQMMLPPKKTKPKIGFRTS